jgi:hypothetical protein
MAGPRTERSDGRRSNALELRALLDEVPDTREIVLRRVGLGDVIHEVWHDASEDAHRAYRVWRRDRGAEAYAAYRAAQDREDAAQDALALTAGWS